jgi:hypothetical protein
VGVKKLTLTGLAVLGNRPFVKVHPISDRATANGKDNFVKINVICCPAYNI